MTVYKLSCDDGDAVFVQGRRPLPDVRAAVAAAFTRLPDEYCVEPIADWFACVIEQFCQDTGYRIVEADVTLNVEGLYFAELRRREEEDQEA